MATLQEIADRCDVSVQTASAVLNTSRANLFRPEVRRKVRQAAVEVGYTPDHSARILRGVPTRAIGVVSHGLSSISGIGVIDIIAGIDEELTARGYRALLGFCWKSADRFREHVKEMRSSRVEGLLILSQSRYFFNDASDVIVPPGLPVVSLDACPLEGADQVKVETRLAMDRLMAEAIRLGHRHFAFVCSAVRSNVEKYDAVADACRLNGYPFAADHVFEGATGMESDSPFVEGLLALRPRPTWIVCSNDFVAAGVIQGLRRRGVRVPREISVSGYDDLACMMHFDPPLTTVAPPREQMGRRMAGMILERIARPQPARMETFIPEVKFRESTGPVPVPETGERHDHT